MQSTRRVLATVNTTVSGGQATKFLTPGNPTGLTGLPTHPSPRSQLIFLYTDTLQTLSKLPSSSAYRASAEALTKHRLSIVENVKPAGLEEWQSRTQALIDKQSDRMKVLTANAPNGRVSDWVEGRIWNATSPASWGKQLPDREWDGEKDIAPEDKYPLGFDADQAAAEASGKIMDVEWEHAPALEAKQVAEIEDKIGGGLIEEVIHVAQGEYVCASQMARSSVWEELVEKAPKGQWEYFAREQHMPGHDENQA